jgi:hypothetical protein
MGIAAKPPLKIHLSLFHTKRRPDKLNFWTSLDQNLSGNPFTRIKPASVIDKKARKN